MNTVFNGLELSSIQRAGICGYLRRLDDGKTEAVVLYGPTGVGKTVLAKRLANFMPVLDDFSRSPTVKNKLGKPNGNFFSASGATDNLVFSILSNCKKICITTELKPDDLDLQDFYPAVTYINLPDRIFGKKNV